MYPEVNRLCRFRQKRHPRPVAEYDEIAGFGLVLQGGSIRAPVQSAEARNDSRSLRLPRLGLFSDRGCSVPVAKKTFPVSRSRVPVGGSSRPVAWSPVPAGESSDRVAKCGVALPSSPRPCQYCDDRVVSCRGALAWSSDPVPSRERRVPSCCESPQFRRVRVPSCRGNVPI